ncbi:MAG TPA: wax ester/triacylglycerol synthase family O-acyltransferase [Pseudomonadales bacterium]|nr:wax ester/triacylglycerol synthase family O-acyltransferase [Pseudomonadales bacterium]
MQQLSGLDSSFIYLETPRTPMNIGGIYIFDGHTPSGLMTYERFKEHIRSRLHVARAFRQRLVDVPMNLDFPYWIDDPDFELDLHLPHVGLPQPGDHQALMKLAADIFSRPLDRARPLWEITFVDGLEKVEGVPKNAFATICKIHHAAVDGVAGEEILSALLDVFPKPRVVEPTDNWNPPDQVPSEIDMIGKTYASALRSPFQFAKLVRKTGRMLGTSIATRLTARFRNPPMILSAPKSCFDATLSAQRVVDGTQLSLERIKRIKNAVPGATVNDVVLAICSGALRKYLLDKEALPENSLVSLAPISIRSLDEKGDAGNRISGMLVSLATDEPDPLARVLRIHESTRGAKEYNKAVEAEKLMDYLPSATFSLAVRLYTRWHLSDKHNPFFNLVTTNVPGPQIPLYLDGSKLLTQIGIAPIFDGMGLSIVIMSYAGNIGIGAISCKTLMPDLPVLISHIETATAELEQALRLDQGSEGKSSEKAAKTGKNAKKSESAD